MDINETDFYALCVNNDEPFYTEIYGLDKNDFNNWMRKNLKEISTIGSFNDVIPSDDKLIDVRSKGYEHVHYQCHYSAKAVTILNEEYRYFTGFVKRNSLFNSIITHSFNIVGKSIVDFARINDPTYPFTQEQLDSVPNTYYGIEIPRDFVLKYENETLGDKSMKPLLYEWFVENNKV